LWVSVKCGESADVSPEKRLKWIKELYKDDKRVDGAVYEGLTVDFCKKIGATVYSARHTVRKRF